MPASYNTRIRKGEPFLLRIPQWKDPDGNVIDPTLYYWELRTGSGAELTIVGSVAGGVVSFALTVAQTSALRFSAAVYVVEATAYAGGDPYRVLEGRINADADPVAS